MQSLGGQRRLRLLLASSSVAALLIGGGAPSALAAPCSNIVTGPFNNAGGHTTPNVCVNNTSFTGNITNEGTISSGIAFVGGTISGQISSSGIIVGGISLDSASKITSGTAAISITGPTFAGGISNSGTISAGDIGIDVYEVSTFTGGISNSGTISAGDFGIYVENVTTFAGGISNSGTIIRAATGIDVSNINQFGSSTGDRISNAGTISAGADGIYVYGVSTFAGGISNSGTISAGDTGIAVGSVSTFAGGISNSGTISADGRGIYVFGVTTFAGGISNSGTISAGLAGISNGIVVSGVNQFGSSTGGGISNSGTISAGADGIYVYGVSTFAGGISNSGTISAGDTGIFVGGVTTFAGGISNSGTISAGADGIFVGGVTTFAGGIGNSGTISAGNAGIFVTAVTTFVGGISNSGTISAGEGIFVENVTTFAGGISNSGRISAGTGILIGPGVTFAAGSAIVNTGTIIGSSDAIKASAATSPVTIDQNAGTITGAILLSAYADQLNISGGTINGNIVGKGSSDTINFTLGSGNTFTYAAAYGFSGINVVNVDSGTVVLNGTNYATDVAVNGGTLEIGDAASPDAKLAALEVAVNDGGTLAGNGTIDLLAPPTVTVSNGGTLAPGTPGGLGTLTIMGDLVFNSGSFYAIDIAPGADNNSKTAVTGGATLNGGTVIVTPEPGKYNTVYHILTTTTGVSGTFASSTPTINGDFFGTMTVDYATNAPNDVDLDVVGTSLLATPPGANQNQQNVAGGINNAILGLPANAMLPPQFENLGNLSGASLLNALTQLSGEAATGAEQSAFQLTTEFLDLMLDPFVNGRGNLGGGAGEGSNPGLGFAPEQQASLPPDIALAYDEVFKTPPKTNFEQRWGAWGSAYGGSSTTEGDPGVGSHDTSAQTYGFAAGMDYHVTPYSVAGFALAGGGTGWGLSDALGTGYSQAFQAGGYGIDWFGHAYLAGALSFSNHWFTTNRAALGDQLRANFVGQNYAARLEGGYRLTPSLPSPASGGGSGWGLGVTPYGAVQFQDFHTPSYSENDLTGGGLGLSYNAMNATDVRTELGARFDDPTLLYGKPLILFGRLAWAHDFVSDPALSAAFEALPGSTFTVNGAPIPHDSALTTAGAQYFLTANWSVIGKFEGEFAGGSQTYAGTGTLRYTW